MSCEHHLPRTLAITQSPPKNYDLKIRVVGRSGSRHCSGLVAAKVTRTGSGLNSRRARTPSRRIPSDQDTSSSRFRRHDSSQAILLPLDAFWILPVPFA